MARPLPSTIAPRGLTPDQAAMYVGYSAKVFGELVTQGLLPAPMPGGNFDRVAIDAALDRLAGLTKPSGMDHEAEARRRIPRVVPHEIRHAPHK